MAVADEIAGTVLVYHAIGEPPPGADSDDLFVQPAAFEEELLYLAAHRRVLSLGTLLDGDLDRGKPAVAITFDDGFRSVLTIAAPLLERFGFPATAFVTTRWLDGSDGGETAQMEAASEATLELLTP